MKIKFIDLPELLNGIKYVANDSIKWWFDETSFEELELYFKGSYTIVFTKGTHYMRMHNSNSNDIFSSLIPHSHSIDIHNHNIFNFVSKQLENTDIETIYLPNLLCSKL